MKYAYLIGLLIAGLVLSMESLAAPHRAGLSDLQQESIEALLRNARQFESENENVSAFLMYMQASELEQFWLNGESESNARTEASRFMKQAMKPNSTLLSEILSSDKIGPEQKKYLLNYLEREIN